MKKDIGNIYDQTLRALPPSGRQRAGKLLRQSVVNRMVKRAIRTIDGKDQVSASFMANQIRSLRRENKTIWGKFSEPERRILNKLEAGLRKEAKGGTINTLYNGLEKFLRAGMRSNIELPRTIKPKTTVAIEDLHELMNYTIPTPGGKAGTVMGVKEPVEETLEIFSPNLFVEPQEDEVAPQSNVSPTIADKIAQALINRQAVNG